MSTMSTIGSFNTIPIHNSLSINTNTKTENDPMIFITKQEYNDMLYRIQQLQIAQDYNQTIIDRLMRRMQQLECVFLSSRHHNTYKIININDSEGDINMNS